ncbi:MAG: VOC family protein [Eubacteriales bacterium]|nr:VOC family protein [Eubacteriales bacterium]MDD3881293.1 VOC family protein [Eubacteriales bacterium]MDD4512211.1 VOC family protein [Eubacteriales bacterium]
MKSVFTNIDCVSFHVDSLDEGIAFYRDSLGLRLLWRTEDSCGLGMDEDISELVLTTRDIPIAQFKVDSVDAVLPVFIAAGAVVDYGPFDIDIGRCAVIRDLFGNRYCILDMTNGKYATDENGNVTGVK